MHPSKEKVQSLHAKVWMDIVISQISNLRMHGPCLHVDVTIHLPLAWEIHLFFVQKCNINEEYHQ